MNEPTDKSEQRVERTFSIVGKKMKVEETTRNGWEEDQEILQLSREEESKYRGFDGEIAEGREWVKAATIPKSNGYEVMHALAEYYNCEVQPK